RDNPRSLRNITAFLRALQHLGWTDGRNVRIDYRWPAGDSDRDRRYAAVTGRACAVILTVGSASLAPVLQATRTVPIVFVGILDPVGTSFVNSLSPPDGNATGVMLFDYDLRHSYLFD